MIHKLRTALILLATLAGYVGVENLIFNTGWYWANLSPKSSAGYIELLLRYERERPKLGPQVLTLGNSRMGFFPFYVNRDPEIGYTFANVAVGGTAPRDWYYMIRDLDPTRRAYAAIAIPVANYDDSAGWDRVDDEIDLSAVNPRLHLSDIRAFTDTLPSPAVRVKVGLGILLKGWTYRADFQDLLTGSRRAATRDDQLADLQRFGWVSPYPLSLRNVSGVEIDWKARRFVFSPWNRLDEKQFVDFMFFSSRTPVAARTTTDWFGRICDLYRGSSTRVILFRLRRGPYFPPDEYAPPHNDRSPVRMLAHRPGVILDDEKDFAVLGDPELFRDPFHFNVQGSLRFSKMFGERIRTLLGPAAR